MGSKLDFDDIDSVCMFRSKKYSKPAEKNKHGQRICFLLKSAEFFSTSNPNLSRSYVKELIEICEKHLIRLKPQVKRKFCKGCYSYLVDGLNSVHVNPLDSLPLPSSTGASVPNGNKVKLASITCLVCTRTRRYRPNT